MVYVYGGTMRFQFLTKNKMKILSLFDWMACWYEALVRAWIKIDKYYASEIDKYAIQIALKNHPDIIEIWDVCNVNWADYDVDLLIGGSPCQWFSVAGKQLAFDDPRSKLFFEFVRIKNECNPKYFLLENVKMKKERIDIISWYLGVQPIEINSALLSAQSRKRLYRTNIPWVYLPKDRGLKLKDILENNVDEKYNLTESGVKMLTRNFGSKWKALNFSPSMIEKITYPSRINQLGGWLDIKTPTLTASMWTGGWNVPCIVQKTKGGTLYLTNEQLEKVKYLKGAKAIPREKNWHKYTYREWALLFPDDIERPSRTILTSEWNISRTSHYVNQGYRIRKLTPVECERLQTLPDNYTEWVSNSQRYKMLGNGWTVDVIAHIFRFIK